MRSPAECNAARASSWHVVAAVAVCLLLVVTTSADATPPNDDGSLFTGRVVACALPAYLQPTAGPATAPRAPAAWDTPPPASSNRFVTLPLPGTRPCNRVDLRGVTIGGAASSLRVIINVTLLDEFAHVLDPRLPSVTIAVQGVGVVFAPSLLAVAGSPSGRTRFALLLTGMRTDLGGRVYVAQLALDSGNDADEPPKSAAIANSTFATTLATPAPSNDELGAVFGRSDLAGDPANNVPAIGLVMGLSFVRGSGASFALRDCQIDTTIAVDPLGVPDQDTVVRASERRYAGVILGWFTDLEIARNGSVVIDGLRGGASLSGAEPPGSGVTERLVFFFGTGFSRLLVTSGGSVALRNFAFETRNSRGVVVISMLWSAHIPKFTPAVPAPGVGIFVSDAGSSMLVDDMRGTGSGKGHPLFQFLGVLNLRIAAGAILAVRALDLEYNANQWGPAAMGELGIPSALAFGFRDIDVVGNLSALLVTNVTASMTIPASGAATDGGGFGEVRFVSMLLALPSLRVNEGGSVVLEYFFGTGIECTVNTATISSAGAFVARNWTVDAAQGPPIRSSSKPRTRGVVAIDVVVKNVDVSGAGSEFYIGGLVGTAASITPAAAAVRGVSILFQHTLSVRTGATLLMEDLTAVARASPLAGFQASGLPDPTSPVDYVALTIAGPTAAPYTLGAEASVILRRLDAHVAALRLFANATACGIDLAGILPAVAEGAASVFAVDGATAEVRGSAFDDISDSQRPARSLGMWVHDPPTITVRNGASVDLAHIDSSTSGISTQTINISVTGTAALQLEPTLIVSGARSVFQLRSATLEASASRGSLCGLRVAPSAATQGGGDHGQRGSWTCSAGGVIAVEEVAAIAKQSGALKEVAGADARVRGIVMPSAVEATRDGRIEWSGLQIDMLGFSDAVGITLPRLVSAGWNAAFVVRGSVSGPAKTVALTTFGNGTVYAFPDGAQVNVHDESNVTVGGFRGNLGVFHVEAPVVPGLAQVVRAPSLNLTVATGSIARLGRGMLLDMGYFLQRTGVPAASYTAHRATAFDFTSCRIVADDRAIIEVGGASTIDVTGHDYAYPRFRGGVHLSPLVLSLTRQSTLTFEGFQYRHEPRILQLPGDNNGMPTDAVGIAIVPAGPTNPLACFVDDRSNITLHNVGLDITCSLSTGAQSRCRGVDIEWSGERTVFSRQSAFVVADSAIRVVGNSAAGVRAEAASMDTVFEHRSGFLVSNCTIDTNATQEQTAAVYFSGSAANSSLLVQHQSFIAVEGSHLTAFGAAGLPSAFVFAWLDSTNRTILADQSGVFVRGCNMSAGTGLSATNSVLVLTVMLRVHTAITIARESAISVEDSWVKAESSNLRATGIDVVMRRLEVHDQSAVQTVRSHIHVSSQVNWAWAMSSWFGDYNQLAGRPKLRITNGSFVGAVSVTVDAFGRDMTQLHHIDIGDTDVLLDGSSFVHRNVTAYIHSATWSWGVRVELPKSSVLLANGAVMGLVDSNMTLVATGGTGPNQASVFAYRLLHTTGGVSSEQFNVTTSSVLAFVNVAVQIVAADSSVAAFLSHNLRTFSLQTGSALFLSEISVRREILTVLVSSLLRVEASDEWHVDATSRFVVDRVHIEDVLTTPAPSRASVTIRGAAPRRHDSADGTIAIRCVNNSGTLEHVTSASGYSSLFSNTELSTSSTAAAGFIAPIGVADCAALQSKAPGAGDARSPLAIDAPRPAEFCTADYKALHCGWGRGAVVDTIAGPTPALPASTCDCRCAPMSSVSPLLHVGDDRYARLCAATSANVSPDFTMAPSSVAEALAMAAAQPRLDAAEDDDGASAVAILPASDPAMRRADLASIATNVAASVLVERMSSFAVGMSDLPKPTPPTATGSQSASATASFATPSNTRTAATASLSYATPSRTGRTASESASLLRFANISVDAGSIPGVVNNDGAGDVVSVSHRTTQIGGSEEGAAVNATTVVVAPTSGLATVPVPLRVGTAVDAYGGTMAEAFQPNAPGCVAVFVAPANVTGFVVESGPAAAEGSDDDKALPQGARYLRWLLQLRLPVAHHSPSIADDEAVVEVPAVVPADIAAATTRTIQFPPLDLHITRACLRHASVPDASGVRVAFTLSYYTKPPSLDPPATQAATSATATVSAATGSPAGAVYAARTSALAQAVSCSLQLGGPLSRVESPLQLQVGPDDDDTRFHAGAAVGNLLLLAGFAAINMGVPLLRRAYFRAQPRDRPSMGTASVVAAAAWGRFPSLSAFAAIMLLPPALTSGIVALTLGGSILSRVAGLLGVAANVGFGVLLWRVLFKDFPATFKPTSDEEAAADGLGDGAMAWVLRPSGEWVDRKARSPGAVVRRLTQPEQEADGEPVAAVHPRDEHPSFVRRHFLIFGDYHGGARWFLAAEVGLSSVIGVVGLLMNVAGCKEVGWVLISLLAAYPVALIVIRPHESNFNLGFTLTLALTQLAGGTVGLVRQSVPDDSDRAAGLDELGGAIAIAAIGLVVLRAIYDVGRVLSRIFFHKAVRVAEERARALKQLFVTGGEENDGDNNNGDERALKAQLMLSPIKPDDPALGASPPPAAANTRSLRQQRHHREADMDDDADGIVDAAESKLAARAGLTLEDWRADRADRAQRAKARSNAAQLEARALIELVGALKAAKDAASVPLYADESPTSSSTRGTMERPRRNKSGREHHSGRPRDGAFAAIPIDMDEI